MLGFDALSSLPISGIPDAGSSNTLISPSSGTLLLVGYAPTVTQTTGNVEVVPSAGNLLIVGYAPTVTQTTTNNEAAPSAGTLQIVGYAPTVEQTTFAAGDAWIFVHEVTVPVTPGSPTQRTFYISERAMITGPTDTPPDTLLNEWLMNAGDLKRDFPLASRGAGLISAMFGGAVYNNTEGQLDDWTTYGTNGGTIVCRYGPWRGAYPSEFFHVYTVRIEGNAIVDLEQAELNARASDYLYDKPIVTEGFDGSGGLEGNGSGGVAKKVMVIGTYWISPTLLDETTNLYFLHNNAVLDPEKLYNGGSILDFAGSYDLADYPGSVPDPVSGQWVWIRSAYGPVYAKLGSAPTVELQARASGAYETPTVAEREWTVFDFATLAGVDVTNVNTDSDLDVGNRLIDSQTYAQVLTDIAKLNIAVVGFDRKDQFFSRLITPSTTGSVVYEFDESNSRNWKTVQGAGSGKRVWRINVKAGPHKASKLVEAVADNSYLTSAYYDSSHRTEITAAKPYLVRDPYMVQFTASSASVLAADSGAEEVTVTLDADSFPDEASMEAWATAYLQLYGARQYALSFQADFSPATASIEIMDRVRMTHSRSAFDNTGRITSIALRLGGKEPTIDFVMWAHADIPNDIVVTYNDLATGAAGRGSAVGVGSGSGASDGRDFSIPLGDETTAITAGTNKRTWYVPFDFDLEEVIAFLKTAQTSGSIYTVDILADGVSIFGNAAGSPTVVAKLTIDNNETSSINAVTPCVIATTFLAKGTKVTFNVDQIGNGTAIGPSVSLTGTRRYTT